MHTHLPRFHVHPLLGLMDLCILFAAGVAFTPLERFGVTVDRLTGVVIQLGGLVTASGLLLYKILEVGRKVRGNASEIVTVKADAASAKGLASDTKKALEDEIARLNAELREARHTARGAAEVANNVARVVNQDMAERDRKSNDPDKPLTVIVANDPAHPVPTVPQPPRPPDA